MCLKCTRILPNAELYAFTHTFVHQKRPISGTERTLCGDARGVSFRVFSPLSLLVLGSVSRSLERKRLENTHYYLCRFHSCRLLRWFFGMYTGLFHA